jgi:hypothetical protein
VTWVEQHNSGDCNGDWTCPACRAELDAAVCPTNPPGVHRYDGRPFDTRCVDCGTEWEGP